MSALHNYGFKLGDFLGNEETELGSLCDEKGQNYPIKSLLELLDIVRTRGKKGLTIQRYKGLGEMDADQLYETTMDPERRKMKRAVLENSEESEKIFSMLMGDEVGPRRKFIEENALLADVDA
jgi:DNA gyrase subunit B